MDDSSMQERFRDSDLTMRQSNATAILGGSKKKKKSNKKKKQSGGPLVAQEETTKINRMRLLLLSVLLVAAVTVASVIAVFLQQEEQDKFETAFLTHASKIMDSLQINIQTQLATLETFAITLTSFAEATNATWPFVTLPDYERRTHSILGQAKSLSLIVLPLVTNTTRQTWEQYSVEHFGEWAQESRDFQVQGGYDHYNNNHHNNNHNNPFRARHAFLRNHTHTSDTESTSSSSTSESSSTTTLTTATATLDYSAGISHVIHTRNALGVRIAAPSTDEFYFPIWQNAPFANQQVENNNLFTLDRYQAGLQVVLQEGKASMGTTANQYDPPDPRTEPFLVTVASLIELWGLQESNTKDDSKDPFGFLFYPIRDNNNNNIVGAMIMYLHWRSLFLDILPPQAAGIDVVFESVCHTTTNDPQEQELERDIFTYRIHGVHAEFVASGDWHDARYDDLEQSISVVDAFNQNRMINDSTSSRYYDGVPLSDKNCDYILRVYPTDMLRSDYTNNATIYYPLVVVGVFLFAAMVFGLYDITVELRQRKVMRTALKTNAIVTSLFPEAIANRMIEEEDVSAMMAEQQSGVPSSFINTTQSMFAVDNVSSHSSVTTNTSTPGNNRRATVVSNANNLLKKTRDSLFSHTLHNRRSHGDNTNNDNNSVAGNSSVGSRRRGSMNAFVSNRQMLSTLLTDGSNRSSNKADDESIKTEKSQPCMAELWPATTVMVADIVGFTSWSSARDPGQVFYLLQTVYQSFDKQAKKKKVFKVETNADSYVAVTGLPQKQDDHAYRMARFAVDCLKEMNELTIELEAELGPDTEELKLRIGLNSGPVTAGVLKGDRARFQLFGDTVNFARCLEGTSKPNRIHLSKTTAQLLEAAGHGDLVVPREGQVHIKGKGVVETCYIRTSHSKNRNKSIHIPSQLMAGVSNEVDQKIDRLIQWNVKILKAHLQKVVARRIAVKGSTSGQEKAPIFDRGGKTCLEEIEDIIAMPPFDPTIQGKEMDPRSVNLGPKAIFQLNVFVQGIAARYHENPFHNFFHASNVTMSVSKMLTRVVSPDLEDEGVPSATNVAQTAHHFSHGITSDPLTHFAVVLSALIHDVDHRGISNAQLAKEDPSMAERYKDKSIAEQNSVDIAWDLLMSPGMSDLRACIYSDSDELHRFRQMLIKTVLATDIFDKELNDLRKKRWAMAFDKSKDVDPALAEQEANVKATIVIEHLIQASDVSHTMQHWHIYRKWNARLFAELYEAYLAGRMGKDPSTFWYNGEIGFFDNYIIPLAKKLKVRSAICIIYLVFVLPRDLHDLTVRRFRGIQSTMTQECQVFGVSSAEFLSYAIANRDEWVRKGEEIVEDMVKQYRDPSMVEEMEDEIDESYVDDDEEDDLLEEVEENKAVDKDAAPKKPALQGILKFANKELQRQEDDKNILDTTKNQEAPPLTTAPENVEQMEEKKTDAVGQTDTTGKADDDGDDDDDDVGPSALDDSTESSNASSPALQGVNNLLSKLPQGKEENTTHTTRQKGPDHKALLTKDIGDDDSIDTSSHSSRSRHDEDNTPSTRRLSNWLASWEDQGPLGALHVEDEEASFELSLDKHTDNHEVAPVTIDEAKEGSSGTNEATPALKGLNVLANGRPTHIDNDENDDHIDNVSTMSADDVGSAKPIEYGNINTSSHSSRSGHEVEQAAPIPARLPEGSNGLAEDEGPLSVSDAEDDVDDSSGSSNDGEDDMFAGSLDDTDDIDDSIDSSVDSDLLGTKPSKTKPASQGGDRPIDADMAVKDAVAKYKPPLEPQQSDCTRESTEDEAFAADISWRSLDEVQVESDGKKPEEALGLLEEGISELQSELDALDEAHMGRPMFLLP
ncbi:Receptor-type guanylate cyclase gcy [Seminavis robusta]|uniref:Receptor-type guanylate cyclase gcy n=1 Tax=Seminavis robusta TaxID=568900 RepID=A0A9N8HJB4_9STRA|nr:Receptor-type guanylate cyclase gcy [Seminavis robusta]|eukprot:Sro682_g186500.1 Receptor-type guanylate cyclase gcy (1844) ;mRNA; f:26328-33341